MAYLCLVSLVSSTPAFSVSPPEAELHDEAARSTTAQKKSAEKKTESKAAPGLACGSSLSDLPSFKSLFGTEGEKAMSVRLSTEEGFEKAVSDGTIRTLLDAIRVVTSEVMGKCLAQSVLNEELRKFLKVLPEFFGKGIKEVHGIAADEVRRETEALSKWGRFALGIRHPKIRQVLFKRFALVADKATPAAAKETLAPEFMAELTELIRKHPDQLRGYDGHNFLYLLETHWGDLLLGIENLTQDPKREGSLPKLSELIREASEKGLDPFAKIALEPGATIFSHEKQIFARLAYGEPADTLRDLKYVEDFREGRFSDNVRKELRSAITRLEQPGVYHLGVDGATKPMPNQVRPLTDDQRKAQQEVLESALLAMETTLNGEAPKPQDPKLLAEERTLLAELCGEPAYLFAHLGGAVYGRHGAPFPLESRVKLLRLPPGQVEWLVFLLGRAKGADRERLVALAKDATAEKVQAEISKIGAHVAEVTRFDARETVTQNDRQVPFREIFDKDSPAFRAEPARFSAVEKFLGDLMNGHGGPVDPAEGADKIYRCDRESTNPWYLDALAVYIGELDGWGLDSGTIVGELAKARAGKISEVHPRVKAFLEELAFHRSQPSLDWRQMQFGQYFRAKHGRSPSSEERLAFLTDGVKPGTVLKEMGHDRDARVEVAERPEAEVPGVCSEEAALKAIFGKDFPVATEVLTSQDDAKLLEAFLEVGAEPQKRKSRELPPPNDPFWDLFVEVLPENKIAPVFEQLKAGKDPKTVLLPYAPFLRARLANDLLGKARLQLPKATPIPLVRLSAQSAQARANGVADRMKQIRGILDQVRVQLLALDGVLALQSLKSTQDFDNYGPRYRAIFEQRAAMKDSVKDLPAAIIASAEQEIQSLAEGMTEAEALTIPPDAWLLFDRLARHRHENALLDQGSLRRAHEIARSKLGEAERLPEGAERSDRYFPAYQKERGARLRLIQMEEEAARLGGQNYFTMHALVELGALQARIEEKKGKEESIGLLGEMMGAFLNRNLRHPPAEEIRPVVAQVKEYCGANPKECSQKLMEILELVEAMAKTNFAALDGRNYHEAIHKPGRRSNPFLGENHLLFTACLKVPERHVAGTEPGRKPVEAPPVEPEGYQSESAVVRALDSLVSPELDRERFETLYGDYFRRKLGPLPEGEVSPEAKQALRFALLEELFQHIATTSSNAQLNRLLAALGNLPESTGPTRTALKEALSRLTEPGLSDAERAKRYLALNKWLREQVVKGAGSEGAADPRVGRLLGLVASALDDRWSPQVDTNHSASAEAFRQEAVQRSRKQTLSDRLAQVEQDAVGQGRFLHGAARRYVMAGTENATRFTDLHDVLRKYHPEQLVQALVAEGKESREHRMLELHKLWGRFRLEPKGVADAAEVNSKRAQAMLNILKETPFKLGEVEQILGHYMREARGLSPAELVAAIDNGLGAHGNLSMSQLLKSRYATDDDKVPIYLALLMDARGIRSFFAAPPKGLAARPDLGALAPMLRELSAKMEAWAANKGDTGFQGSVFSDFLGELVAGAPGTEAEKIDRKYPDLDKDIRDLIVDFAMSTRRRDSTRDELAQGFAGVIGRIEGLPFVLNVVRGMVEASEDTEADLKQIHAHFPFLNDRQLRQMERFVHVVRLSRGDQPKSDAELRELLAKHVFRVTYEHGKSDFDQIPPDLRFDVDSMVWAVKNVHALLDRHRPASPNDSRFAVEALSRAAAAQDPRTKLNGWASDELQRAVKQSNLLSALYEYQNEWVDPDAIELVLKQIEPPLAATEETPKRELTNLSRTLKAVRWLAFKSDPSDELIAATVAESAFGITGRLDADMAAKVAALLPRVKLGLKLLREAPAGRAYDQAIESLLGKDLQAKWEARVMNDYFKLARLTFHQGSELEKFAGGEAPKLDRELIGYWDKSIRSELARVASVIKAAALDSIHQTGEAREQILHALATEGRWKLGDKPGEIRMDPTQESYAIQLMTDREGTVHELVGLREWLTKQLNEENDRTISSNLQMAMPIAVRDLTRFDPKHSDKAPVVGPGNEVYGQALAVLRCRLLSEILRLEYGGRVNIDELVHFDSDTKYDAHRLSVLYAKLVRDIEGALISQISDREVDVAAFRDELRRQEPAQYLEVLRRRAQPRPPDRLQSVKVSSVTNMLPVPGCQMGERWGGHREVNGRRESYYLPAWRLQSYALGDDRTLTRDSHFLGALNDELSKQYGPYRGTYGMVRPWELKPGDPHYEYAMDYAHHHQSRDGKGQWPPETFAPQRTPAAVERALAALPTDVRVQYAGRLKAAQEEAARREKYALNQMPGYVLGARVVNSDHGTADVGRALVEASRVRKSAYDAILEEFARTYVVPATPIPAEAELRLLGLPVELRQTLLAVLRHHRSKAASLEKEMQALDLSGQDPERLAKLRAEYKVQQIRANRLVLDPDLSTLAVTAWDDPALREWMLEQADPRLLYDLADVKVKGFLDKLRRWDTLLLKEGEKPLTPRERESLRDGFLEMFALLQRPGSPDPSPIEKSESERKSMAVYQLALMFRVSEETGSLRYARENSHFAAAYEPIFGGDARFVPENVVTELKRERQAMKECEKEPKPLPCAKLTAFLESEEGQKRGVATQTRLRLLAQDDDKLEASDFAELERLTSEILPHSPSQTDNKDSVKMTRELLFAAPSREVIQQAARVYDLARQVYSEQYEPSPNLETEAIDLLLKVAEKPSARTVSYTPAAGGKWTRKDEAKACDKVIPLPPGEDAIQLGGEVVADLDFTPEEQTELRKKIQRIANYELFSKKYSDMKQAAGGQEPPYSEVLSSISSKSVQDKIHEIDKRIREEAAKRYLEKALAGGRAASSLNLSNPASRHGCALRALMGPVAEQQVIDNEAGEIRGLKGKVATNEHGAGDESAVAEVTPEEMEKGLRRFLERPDILVAMEHHFGDRVARKEEGKEVARPIAKNGQLAETLRRNLGQCYATWRNEGKALPALQMSGDANVTALQQWIEAEQIGARSFEQANAVESEVYGQLADVNLSDTAMDLQFFADPKDGMVERLRKQLERFKDPEKNPLLKSDKAMRDSVARMEQDLVLKQEKVSDLRHELYRARLRYEAAISSPLANDKSPEETKADLAIVSLAKSLISAEIQRKNEELEAEKRPLHPPFVSQDFILTLEQHEGLKSLAHAFNLDKLTKIEQRRAEYKLPEAFNPLSDLGTLNEIKLRGLIRVAASRSRQERAQKMREDQSERLSEQFSKAVYSTDENFYALARQCMERLEAQGKYVFSRADGSEFEANQYDQEEVQAVVAQMQAFEMSQLRLKAVMASLLPQPGVDLPKGVSSPEEIFKRYIEKSSDYLTLKAAMMSDQAPFPLSGVAFRADEEAALHQVIEARSKEDKSLRDTLDGLTELGFQWNGSSLQWGEGKDGLKLHLIGPNGKIKSLVDLRRRLTSLKTHGVYKNTGQDPWSLLLVDIFAHYAKARYKPIFEFGNSAVCILSFTGADNRAEGYYSSGTTPQPAGQENICLWGGEKVLGGRKYESANLHRGQMGAPSFAGDLNHAELYLEISSLEAARERATTVARAIQEKNSGESSAYNRLRQQLITESNNVFSAFKDLDEFSFRRNPQSEWWIVRNVGWTHPKGMANAMDKAWAELTKVVDELHADVRTLDDLGALTVRWRDHDHEMDQDAGTIARGLRQHQKYITEPDYYKSVPREVFENLQALDEFYTDMAKTEAATLGLGGLLKAIPMAFRALKGAEAVKYALALERMQRITDLGTNMIKGWRSAYRFGLGGKVAGDIISNFPTLWKDGSVTQTQPATSLLEGAKKSRWVFAALPATQPAVDALVRLGGVPAHLAPWLAGPLAMGGTHYANEVLHGADWEHSLVGSVPMMLFGLPVGQVLGKAFGWAGNRPLLGAVLRRSYIQDPLNFTANYLYFALVSGSGGVLDYYFTPEINLDPDTGERVYVDPNTGKVVEDPTLIDIFKNAAWANKHMDAFFAKGHVKQVRAHMAAEMILQGRSYPEVITYFGGNSPAGRHAAQRLIGEGMAHFSVSDVRRMRTQISNLRRAIEKEPTDVVSKQRLSRLERTLSILANTAGYGKGEVGKTDLEGINAMMAALEKHTNGGKGNQSLFGVADKIALRDALALAAELRQRNAPMQEWAKAMESPAFHNLSPGRIFVIPADILYQGLNSKEHAPAFQKILPSLAAASEINAKYVPALGEWMAHYKPGPNETPYDAARRFSYLLAESWVRTPNLGRFVAEGRLSYDDLAAGIGLNRRWALGGATVRDIRILERDANQADQAKALPARRLLIALAEHHGVDVPMLLESAREANQGAPALKADARYGEVGGDKYGSIKDSLLSRTARALRDQVVQGKASVNDMIEFPWFRNPEHSKHVPTAKLNVGAMGDAKPADESHLNYIDRVGIYHADLDSTFRESLTERGVHVSEFLTYLRAQVRAAQVRGNAGTLPEIARQAKLDFMASIRAKERPAEMKIETFKDLSKQWADFTAASTGGKDDPAARATGVKLRPALAALAERAGFVDSRGNPAIHEMVQFLDSAVWRGAPLNGPDTRTVADLLPEAQRLARQNLADLVWQGKIPVGALLAHGLFVDTTATPLGGSKLVYRPEAAGQIPQKPLLDALRAAETPQEAMEYAVAIAAIAQASGYSPTQLGEGFVSFVGNYHGSAPTIAEVTRLYLKGSPKELGRLVVNGDLAVTALEGLPETTGTKVMAAAAGLAERVANVEIPIQNRKSRVLNELTVEDLGKMLDQSRDPSHRNSLNAKEALRRIGERVGAEPELFLTFLDGYRKGKETSVTYAIVGDFLGVELDKRQMKTVTEMAKDLHARTEPTVKEGLIKHPEILDGIAQTGFFDVPGRFKYLPPGALRLTDSVQPRTPATVDGPRETVVPASPLHLALVEQAVTEALVADPIFTAKLRGRQREGTNALQAFVDHVKGNIVADPAKYPDLAAVIRAAKGSYRVEP